MSTVRQTAIQAIASAKHNLNRVDFKKTHVTMQPRARNSSSVPTRTADELARRIAASGGAGGGFDAIITGWRTPRFTSAVLEAARARPLKLVAHSAGSVKFLLEDERTLGRDFT